MLGRTNSRRLVAIAALAGLALGSVVVPAASAVGSGPTIIPLAAPVNVFDLAASTSKSWTVPTDGVQLIELVEFVGSGGFGGDSFYGASPVKRTGGHPCEVHASAAAAAGQVYNAVVGERGGDGSLDIVDPDTADSRRLGGAGGKGYRYYSTVGQSGGNGGDSYTSNPLFPGEIVAGGGGGGGATGIVDPTGYPIYLVAAGGGGASPTKSVDQGVSCVNGSSSQFGLGLPGCSNGGDYCGGAGIWTAGGAGGTHAINRLCPNGITGVARAQSGAAGTNSNAKGIGGAGAKGLPSYCGEARGAGAGGGGGGGATGGGGGASQSIDSTAGPGGSGSSRGGFYFNYARQAAEASLAYVRWVTIDTPVVATGDPGTPSSTTLTATFGDPAVPYFTTAAWKWTATGLPTGWTIGATTGVLAGPLPATPVTFKVTAAYRSSNLDVAKTSRMYTVGGASGVSVTAKAASSVYGATPAAIGYDTSGLTAADWFTSIDCGAFEDAAGTTPITSSTKPGTYATVCTGPATSGLGTPITYTNGVYTVSKAPLTITAKSFTKTYGDALTLVGSSDFTVTGLVGTDAVSSVTLTTSGDVATAPVSGSPYSVVPSAAVGAASQVLTDWYTITYTNGSIVVNSAAALTVTPKTYTIDLGDTSLDAATLGFDVIDFVNSETFATAGYTAPTCGVYDGATLKSPPYSSLAAGTYTVKCSGGAAGNYSDINYGESKFVVKAANVGVTAKAGSSTYGTAPASDTGSDVVGDLNGVTVTCRAYTDGTYSTEVTASTRPGKYVTHCTGASDNGGPDFTPIDYVDGAYVVGKAPLTITAASRSKTYGEVVTLDDDLSDGSTDVTVTGLVNSDAVLSLTLTTSGDVATAGVAGSPYSIVPSAAVLDCECDIEDFYDITYVDGTITVNKKTLAVTAKDVNLQLGASVPTSYEFTATGWENGENSSTNLPDGWVPPTCTSSFNSTTPVGTPVDIVCSGGSADDYDFTFTAGTAAIGNPEVEVENTTTITWPTPTYTAPVTLSASLVSGRWSPGCLVTFSLDPSLGTDSPYSVYPDATQISDGTPVTITATLPLGVYDIVTTLSGNCTAAEPIAKGFVAVVPIGPSGAAHVDTYGTRYVDANTSKTITLNMEWLRKWARMKNAETGAYEYQWVNDSYYNWSTYGTNQWRIASKPFSGTVTLTDGGTQSATVSTWGRTTCPDGMYPAGNVSICSAVTNIVMLQEWVPRPSNPKYGTWRDLGEVLIVEKLAEGLWPYRCATVACKTPLPDYVAFQMRPVPGDTTPTVIPLGVPAFTDWTRATYREVLHKQR